MHFGEICKIIDVGEDPAAGWVVLQVIKHPIHLIHVPFGIVVLHAQLIAVGLTDGAGFVRPLIPDFGIEVMDIV